MTKTEFLKLLRMLHKVIGISTKTTKNLVEDYAKFKAYIRETDSYDQEKYKDVLWETKQYISRNFRHVM